MHPQDVDFHFTHVTIYHTVRPFVIGPNPGRDLRVTWKGKTSENGSNASAPIGS